MNTRTEDSFAVFILTHGRAEHVTTYRTIRRQGYTGPIFLLVDNEDGQVEEYRRRYPGEVIVFDKEAVARRIDEADNFEDRRAVLYARNACFEEAAKLGLEYFLQLDDDYQLFDHRFAADLHYQKRPVKDLDRAFASMLRYFKAIPALSIAFGQGGDCIGGWRSGTGARLRPKRKAMNSFFCSTRRPFCFQGRVNEDVNTYVELGRRGSLFLTIFNISLTQAVTQQIAGGMTGLYLDQGTYIKSFYSVMFAPSCVVVSTMRSDHLRIHHKIRWDDAVPCILRREHGRKEEREGGPRE